MTHTIRPFRLVLFALAAVLAFGAGNAPAAAPKPNVVLIFIDDMGYGDVGAFGNTRVRTPHIDRLAAEGRKFTSFYATPVCSMSRACLLTGCYNVRVSIPGVLFPGSQVGLNPAETTVAELLKGQGYATACIGKWHLGHQPQFLPTRQGFDHYFGLPYSNDMHAGRNNYPPLPLIRGEKTIETEPDQSQLTKRYTEEAVKFLREHRDGPFFLYLPHTMVHAPLAASADFKGKSQWGLLGDAIEEIDWSVGQVMKTLKDLGLDEKTLVIFTSDNGPAAGSAGPYRGKKGTTFEGGMREPCIMRWPGKVPPGTTCPHIAGNIDVLPTLAKLAGAELPADRVLDGRDVSSLLFEADPSPVRDTHLYFTGNGQLAAIRSGDWKLFLALPPAKKAGAKAEKAKQPAAGQIALYNLAADVGETKDVSAEHPDVVARLQAEAKKREAEIKAHQRPPGRAADARP